MAKGKSFEKSIARLEEIVHQMEQGSVTLEESLKLFEEGTALAAACSKQLDEAELKIIQVAKNADGSPKGVPFNTEE